METKPFSMQSPESIAKEYSGNKQKIAQAMQMGIVDPTAGTLAGMFIDRMRSAQMQEQGPPQTVAQQVFAPPQPAMPQGAPPPGAGAPPMGGMPPRPPMGGMPPAPPMGPPPGAGAPPMGGMPPAPPMGPPPGAGAPPPMGLAGGGLAALPIPDAMFEEPTNGGYANGGIVAFAGGNEVEDDYGYDGGGGGYDLPQFASMINQPSGDGSPESIAAAVELARESMRRTGRSAASDVISASGVIPGSGTRTGPAVPSSADMLAMFGAKPPATAAGNMAAAVSGGQRFAAIAPTIASARPQTSAAEENALRAVSGGQRFFNPMEAKPAPKAPVTPKPVTPASSTMTGKTAERKALNASLGLDKPLVSTPKRDAAKPGEAGAQTDPNAFSPTDIKANMKLAETLMGPRDETATNAVKAQFQKVLSPEYQDKEKKKDMWMALAQIGFGMAGTQSPHFLQAVGQAGAAALPGIMSANKERKAEFNNALKGMADIEGISNREKREIASFAVNATQAAYGNKMKADELAETVNYHAKSIAVQMAEIGQRERLGMAQIRVGERANELKSGELTAWQEAQIRDKAVQRLQSDPTFFVLSQRAAKDPQAAIKLQQLYKQYGVSYGDGSATSGPTPGNRPPLSSF